MLVYNTGVCHRGDGQELESDNENSNDLPYRHHKRACLCLVCRAQLVGEPLPDQWMTCAFMSRLPHVRQLLRASSWRDAMNIEQLLTRVRAIMTDDGGCEVSAATSVGQPHSDAEVPYSIRRSGTVICYKCSGLNHMARNCTAGGLRQSMEIWLRTTVFLMQ